MNDDAVVCGVAHAIQRQVRRVSHVKLKPEVTHRRLHLLCRNRIGANQRGLVSDFKKLRFGFHRHYFFFPYSTSRLSPLKSEVFSPRVFLILSRPRVTTPLLVQYSSAFSSVIIPVS